MCFTHFLWMVPSLLTVGQHQKDEIDLVSRSVSVPSGHMYRFVLLPPELLISFYFCAAGFLPKQNPMKPKDSVVLMNCNVTI